MSDTPRTDAILSPLDFPWPYSTEVVARHAEQLERELRAARNAALEDAAKVAETCHDFGPDTTDPQRAYFLGLEDAAKKIRELKNL